jgi:hypothetical protein
VPRIYKIRVDARLTQENRPENTKKGLIEIKEFMERGKKLKKIQYILTKDGFEEKARLTYYFLQMKEKEYFELKKESEAYGIAKKEHQVYD